MKKPKVERAKSFRANVKSVRLSYNITRREAEAIEEVAYRSDSTLSAYTRRAVLEKIEREGNR